MTITQPPADTSWKVSKSFLFEHPPAFQSDSLVELRRTIAEFARAVNATREQRKRIRDLSYRYEADDFDLVTAVHVYFTGYANKQIRLFKLERIV